MKFLLKLAAAGAVAYAAVQVAKKYDLVNKATEAASAAAAKLVSAWPFEYVQEDNTADDEGEPIEPASTFNSHSSAWAQEAAR